ncbi:MAG: Asp-tRNA(Asn)/Glu-tRNA(Gln) amidotransferase subunit GatA [Mycoplasma sp.]|nr:Asp-tRNA(Asn)/Glu-tRNA(Gln) amidotransferase subunit GatA [Mycoplasma sp.]
MNNIKNTLKELKENNNNAVAFIYYDAKFSEGPFNGMTVTIKDIFATKDAPTQCSSKILEGFEPQYDATVVSKIKNSGAAIVAKTHLDELALGGTGEYSAWGNIVNPLDKTRYIGGSSSGAAATLTNNITFALGSDTGDSVRLPASFVGKVGFKPSYGSVSRYGLFAFASSLDTVGWLSHDVNTSINVSELLFGKDKKDMTSKDINIKGIKKNKPKTIIALDVGHLCKDYVSKEYDKLILELKKNNIKVKKLKINEKLFSTVNTVYNIISYSEASSNDSNLTGIAFGKRVDGKSWSDIMTNTRSAKFGPMVQRRFTLGSFFLESENQTEYFLRAQKVRRLIKEEYLKLQRSGELIIFPSTGEIANKIGEKRLDNLMSSILTTSNLVGNPSITLPWGKEKNMPFGIQLETELYKDKELLSYALWIEDFLGDKNE